MDTQWSSNWCENPAAVTTAHASSSVTLFIRSRMASGTLGRPSGNRSPFQSGVYSISCCFVSTPGCAWTTGVAVSRKTVASRVLRMAFLVVTQVFVEQGDVGDVVALLVLEPVEVRSLRGAGEVLTGHPDER